MLSPALTAQAPAKEPAGDFAVFKQCPRFTPTVNFCIFAQIGSGEVKIGTTAVPIHKTITLQGGYFRDEEVEPVKEIFFGAINGETLSKAPQAVPGGLLGIVAPGLLPKSLQTIFNEFVDRGLTNVTATTELARPAGSIGLSTDNLINEEGTGLSLPVKVRLNNPFLGSDCYIGSSSGPVTFEAGTGTTRPPAPNRPIKGRLGNLEFKDELTFIEVTENTLVDNSFSVPRASGCGGALSLLIDPVIDAKLGLPSPAGKNTLIQHDFVKLATAGTVIASEK
jgi:hypothetical protein